MLKRKSSRKIPIITICIIALCIGVVAAPLLIYRYPGLAARAADPLRDLIGDRAVAWLETQAYRLQDSLRMRQENLAPPPPEASRTPWQPPPLSISLPNEPTSGVTPHTTGLPSRSNPLAATTAEITPVAPSPTPEPVWQPAPVNAAQLPAAPTGWSPFLQDDFGRVVAYRVDLRPDDKRRYTTVAVIAFDLANIRLNYVLGKYEPRSQVEIERTGRIPLEVLSSGRLLAAFNGGFKARHGSFGVMLGGQVLIPPRDGMGTLTIDQDGAVRIQEWHDEVAANPRLALWRQNGPLILDQREITPETALDKPELWGYTVGSTTAVWRSGIGVSADSRTLYYYAGPSLTLPSLALAMQASGASEAIQLDINEWWVHFDSIQEQDGSLKHIPLSKNMADEDCDRFLGVYDRDYFYITAGEQGAPSPYQSKRELE